MPNNMPYTQWYWDDWLAATVLLSPATRGIWFDLIGSMYRLDRVGVITGTAAQLARAGRCDVVEMEAAIKELKMQEVADIKERNGYVTLVCRRINKEYKARNNNKLRVKKHREKADVTPMSLQCNATRARNNNDRACAQARDDINIINNNTKSNNKKKNIKEKELSPNAVDLRRRLNGLFHRRDTTAWSDHEIERLIQIAERSDCIDEFKRIEELYLSGYIYRRRDIMTLLNNWTVELDRAGSQQNVQNTNTRATFPGDEHRGKEFTDGF